MTYFILMSDWVGEGFEVEGLYSSLSIVRSVIKELGFNPFRWVVEEWESDGNKIAEHVKVDGEWL